MNIRLVAAALLASVAIPAFSANATDLEVTHWWTSGGEAAAVKVLADQYNALGNNHWVDGAIAGSGSTATPLIVSRILGGNPMGATQLNTGRDAEELVKAGLMTDLTDLAEKEHWKDIIRPASLLASCTYEGRVYCVPLNIHSWQWMWVNRHVFEDNGMKVPANWDEFVADAPKLREKGIIPLATGAPWQVDGMRSVMQIGIGGKETYLAIYQKKDADAVKSPENRKVWDAFAQARDLVDESYSGRDWNVATNMVITGKAAAQIMGDWAQGEFGVAKQVAGKDYDCLPGLGFHGLLDTGGDSFYFPKNSNADITKAQLELASMLVSKETQVKFNLAKGSLPVRGDIDLSAASSCMKKGLEILKNPDNVVPGVTQLIDPDTRGQMTDLGLQFFSSKMTVDEAIEKQAAIFKQAQ
ncbi:carbohydrate ABC transporter substrate-binding protein [Agrobacterium rhizogenes]|jgi:glucose/mannose transport system substrate-binding protein|uniref:Probable sugar-binding periplasmic protein n=2 Tax=unclassified Rhizobium TaxID=2613769 RepID=A0AAU7SG54_9HYPH|nr:carbohydrate ABC transporter substrate-binding protein [Rhizobium rhizogenes]NTJ76792.1 carbohydrate ABC transporter substrate-binding protein [Rhizobium rhizogenes]